MQFITRNTIIDHLAKADALYYAIGMSITILELALIATNKNFGIAGLELSFLIQIIFSVIIESSAGMFFLKNGPYVTTICGMLSKTMAVLLLGGAVICSSYFGMTATWIFLITFFVIDGVGSGCLLSAFRPAYAQWFSKKMNDTEEADFLAIFRMKMSIRIGLPLVILLFSVLFFYMGQRSPLLQGNYYFYSSIVIIGTMLCTRLYQLKTTATDFKGLNYIVDNESNSSEQHDSVTIQSFKATFRNIKENLLVYLVGDIAYLSVMMYAIGLGFKLTTKFSLPFYLAWLGGALIGFVIYLLSSLFGYFIYPKFSDAFHHKKIALAILLLLLPTIFCGVAFYVDAVEYQIIALFVFCLTSVTIGNGLLRLMTNQIIRKVESSHQQAIFIFAEAMASISIALAVIISLYMSINNATIISLLSFIFLLGLMSIYMLMRPSALNELEALQHKPEIMEQS